MGPKDECVERKEMHGGIESRQAAGAGSLVWSRSDELVCAIAMDAGGITSAPLSGGPAPSPSLAAIRGVCAVLRSLSLPQRPNPNPRRRPR